MTTTTTAVALPWGPVAAEPEIAALLAQNGWTLEYDGTAQLHTDGRSCRGAWAVRCQDGVLCSSDDTAWGAMYTAKWEIGGDVGF